MAEFSRLWRTPHLTLRRGYLSLFLVTATRIAIGSAFKPCPPVYFCVLLNNGRATACSSLPRSARLLIRQSHHPESHLPYQNRIREQSKPRDISRNLHPSVSHMERPPSPYSKSLSLQAHGLAIHIRGRPRDPSPTIRRARNANLPEHRHIRESSLQLRHAVQLEHHDRTRRPGAKFAPQTDANLLREANLGAG